MTRRSPFPSRHHIAMQALACILVCAAGCGGGGGGSGTGGATGGVGGGATAAGPKPRLVVLTDISPITVEPDDSESLIRLLVHADLYEIEGLIGSSGWSTDNFPASWLERITSTIDAYEKDAPNLRKRSDQTGFLADEDRQEIGYWPSPAYLKSRTMAGSARQGFSILGAANDSPGSDLIIQLADENDDRPLWVTAWGGGNTLAQAIWRVQQDRTPDQLRAFLRKVRLYTITDQDKALGANVPYELSSHQWMRREFGQDLLFLWDECAWTNQNSTGVSRWTDYEANIQGHGNLGGVYPKYIYGVEGDTPSFLHLMPTGLNDPNVPTQAGWGGYFAFGQTADGQTSGYVNQTGSANATCQKYVTSFYQAEFNNFAARMDWAKAGAGNRNPVVVVDDDRSTDVLTLRAPAGGAVSLDAAKTHDPDGDALTFKWWIMSESGTYPSNITIPDSGARKVTIAVPADSAGTSFHVICEVTDGGTPNLTSYRRVVVNSTAGP